ncbi:glycosyltransferase family 90 protein [Thermothelomyces thermophilus ATCC 42464]|uniref:Glycosyltransferase family 90 protein n=1 Tax=Thermothelomyces thermophilus (strain ATCC 42464 / BCRC 31852 / DSM 1799) TaxID=573729 RepID=G2QI79_THET4|nr:glycosyltransferase family 90 protein [Thermothelomyces thermophilus ATCC 42464]AEO60268.1 glycosyltransferase family 90 protein [Thermothelomyces thermophilus ATCC 42464]
MVGFPRRPSTAVRYIVRALLLIFVFYSLLGPSDPSQDGSFAPLRPWRRLFSSSGHPIDKLVKAAEKEFASKIAKATKSLPDAAAAYRKRRGRHPPPGFDQWYQFAVEKQAIIVEDFWDQIYHDLEPFWALDPARIRKDAREFEMRIHIRDHKASTESDWFWTQIWLTLIQTIEHLLPDMDLALNPMDEPRVVASWEDVNEYLREAAKTKTMANPKEVVSNFGKLPPVEQAPPDQEQMPPVIWESDKHYWRIVRRGCPPDSPAREAEVITDFDQTPAIADPFSLAHMRDGYVANYTLSTSFCHQPDLQALEGIFVEPLSVSATKSLLPMFGGSKLAVNNDILLPAPIYWNEEDRFVGAEGASIPWEAKHAMAAWRGVATGGRNRPNNWRSFQRHRFVAMNNASILSDSSQPPPNFALPSPRYPLPDALPDWISANTNIGFTDMMCLYVPPPEESEPGFPGCNYTVPFFSIVPSIPMADQFHFKILPDIDGNSFSGRYLGFLKSTSLPIKSTLWREWHDSRLVAWKHFVPMDNRFGDWFGLLAYFLGNGKTQGRDDVAKKIAMDGRDWAARVLRKEDMQVYVLRLLLEYARVVDERREMMGWVDDLL